ncbi:Bacterial extracellular solute-binding protein, family 3 [compost metagenome]
MQSSNSKQWLACVIGGLLLLLAALPFMAHAQSLKVATGDPKGTYSKMFKELTNACATTLTISEVPTNGSMTNIDKLAGNEVNAAIVQTDVLKFRSNNEDLSSIKTLVALHPEAVHIIARNETFKVGGTMGFGGKEVSLNTINDLAGRKVGAIGGSVITAQVMRIQAEIPYQVISFPDGSTNDTALASLAKKEIDAVIAVGGFPLAWASGLGPQYKMLSIPESTAAKLKNVYSTTRVTYAKMGATGVQTVATDALFVTREYKTAKYVDGLSKLRSCFYANLDDLKETTGNHPAWSKVSADTKGKWVWYDLPETQAQAATPARKR